MKASTFKRAPLSKWDQEIIRVERSLLSLSFREFVEAAWPQIEPSRPFQTNWHIDQLCEVYQAITEGHLKRVVINIPPGSMKSLAACVMWPAWSWTHSPHLRWLFGSYSATLARRDSLRTRDLLMTEWYQERWGHCWRPNAVEWGSTKFSNSFSGYRMATSVQGGATGEHADVQVADDPIKPIDAISADKMLTAALLANIQWWDETMSTRLAEPAKSARVIIMQRLHTHDLAGHALKNEGYTHICLPMEFEPQRKCIVRLPGRAEPLVEDKRHHENELLWPARYPYDAVKGMKIELGSRAAAAQLQQRPIVAGGGVFKLEYMQHWAVFPRKPGTTYVQSWDCAFKDLNTSDYVVGQLWAVYQGCFYLLDQMRGHWALSATCKAIAMMALKYPQARCILIEDKANGPAVQDTLQLRIPGIKMIEPCGGKYARANAVEPLWESKNVYLPDPKKYPWVLEFIDEHVTFPFAGKDDQVDAGTQAVNYLHKYAVNDFAAAFAPSSALARIRGQING